MSPNIDNLVVTFVACDETHIVFLTDSIHFLVSLSNQILFHGRNQHIAEIERQTAFVSHVVTHVLDIIQELGCDSCTKEFHHVTDDVAQSLLVQQSVDVAKSCRNDLVEFDTTHCCLHHLLDDRAVFLTDRHLHVDDGVHVDLLLVVGDDNLFC